jgi:hypothetical protein
MRYLTLIAVLFFAACSTGQPLTKGPAQNNGTYNVSYLFENEGCKVYRFSDNGMFIYYTNCNGSTVARTDSTAIMNSTHAAH